MKTKKFFLNTFFLLVIALAVAGCNSSIEDNSNEDTAEKVCNCKNPVKDLPWLKKIVEDIEKNMKNGLTLETVIYQCTYNDGTEGFYRNHYGLASEASTLYDCEGNILENFTSANHKDFEDKWNIQNLKVIWKNFKD